MESIGTTTQGSLITYHYILIQMLHRSEDAVECEADMIDCCRKRGESRLELQMVAGVLSLGGEWRLKCQPVVIAN